MKKKIIIIVSILAGIGLILILLNQIPASTFEKSQKKAEKEIVGIYVTEDNYRTLDVRSDGTYDYDKEYGTGRWHYLESGELEFIDFYGDNYKITTGTDENGEYIKYSGRTFYKTN